MIKATHNGTCQACGRAQAFYKGTVAKHGYTVDWGHFNGVCAGAEAKPLEQDKTLTEATIKCLLEDAVRCDKRAADLRSGAVVPKFVRWTGKWIGYPAKQEMVECQPHELGFRDQSAQSQIDTAIWKAEGKARSMRSHCKMLEQLIEARHGKPLQPIIGRKEVKAGSRVQLFGKKDGVTGTVQKVDYKVASGVGPYLNGHTMLHAWVKDDASEHVYIVPVRNIRQAAILD